MTTVANILPSWAFSDGGSGIQGITLTFTFADPSLQSLVSAYPGNPTYQGTIGSPANHGAVIFTDPHDMISFYLSTASAALVTQINNAQSAVVYSAGSVQYVDTPISTSEAVLQPLNQDLTDISSVNSGSGLAAPILSLLSQPTIAAVKASMAIVSSDISDFNTAALSASLSGLSTSTNSAITSSDTLIVAMGKLQAQMTATASASNVAISTITPSLVSTGATGTQVSATKRSTLHVGISESVTSSIGGAATAVVNIKICATNSATEANWTTISTFEEDQTVTLAIALQSIQVMKGIVTFELPAGWYWKTESSGSGTNIEGLLVGQQIIYG